MDGWSEEDKKREKGRKWRETQRMKTFRNMMLQLQSGENGQENSSNGFYGSATLAVHFTTNSIRLRTATGRTLGRKYN